MYTQRPTSETKQGSDYSACGETHEEGKKGSLSPAEKQHDQSLMHANQIAPKMPTESFAEGSKDNREEKRALVIWLDTIHLFIAPCATGSGPNRTVTDRKLYRWADHPPLGVIPVD
jgi:hypothetical protein